MPASYKHNHVQTVPAIQWTINHNLNTLSPVCDCHVTYEGAVHKILPLSVEVLDAMNIRVSWSIARSGTCTIR